MRRIFQKIMLLWLRKKTPIQLSDYFRNKPISNVFGLDRGSPIDLYFIDQFLKSNIHLIKGVVLEIAENTYSKKYGGNNIENIEVLHAKHGNKNATIVGDLTDTSTLPENSIDCFICTQTLNFIFDIQSAIRGAYHVLKPGGVLLLTVAGISQISRYDMEQWGDYWRFTEASLDKLFKSVFTNYEIKSYGNVLAATSYLQGVVVEDLPSTELLDYHDPDYQMLITVVAKKE